jgi:hypothetical protein
MGLRDRIAKTIAGTNVEKAPNLPAGSVTMTEQQMRNAVPGAIGQNYGTVEPLPRNPLLAGVPFGPGIPITPGAINPVDPLTGRPAPRRYEYQVAQNINITETKLVPFKTLRAAADQIDILRRCVEVIKGKISGLEWDIVLGQDASEKIMSDSGGDHVRAMVKAREDFNDDIYRLKTFWENPDKSNGLTFTDWLNIALEELLVIDALAIWPQKTVGGDLYGLQILDGATIKPMLDDRGMRPQAPQAAYQQILYGFPRAEFSANQDDPKADGEFTSDDLAYLVKNRRTTSVYGYSPVERSLPLADIYLRRQQWIRAEYTDGVLPELMFSTDATWGTNPDLLRAWENILNDDLAGQTEQRKRARLLPTGITPITNDSYGEKFKDTLDDFLIASICGHFGVQPTEIGYSPKGGGLGGKGFEEGKQTSAEVVGIQPIVNWLNKMISNLSYAYLGMPRELEFKLMVSKSQEDEASARKAQIEVTSAGKTVNERRSELGLPLLDTPQADMPILVSGSSVYLFSPDGMINPATQGSAPQLEEDGETAIPGTEAPNTAAPEAKPKEGEIPEGKDTSNEVAAEVKAFMKWAAKGQRKREFEFKMIDPIVGEALNRCAVEGDLDTARSLAKAYLA